MIPFLEFCETMETVSKTTKRKEKSAFVAQLLTQASTETELEALCYFSIGMVNPTIKLGISWRSVNRVIQSLSGKTEKAFRNQYRENADFGSLVEFALQSRKKDLTQFLSTPAKEEKKYFILDIYNQLLEITNFKGKGSIKVKNDTIRRIFSQISPLESKYIARFLTEDARTGFRVGMLDEAISRAYNVESNLVRRTRMLIGDAGKTAVLAKKGTDALKNVSIELFRPIGLMLAEKAEQPENATSRFGEKIAVEPKIDGIRAQIHRDTDGSACIFSRRLENITDGFPDLVEGLSVLQDHSVILDGEIVAFIDGKPVFFQDLIQRKRKHQSKDYAEKLPVQFFAFDIIYKDGKLLIDEPYTIRRQELEDLLPNKGKIQPIDSFKVTTEAEIRKLFDKFSQKYEGVMIKALDGPYVAGRRGKHWMKLKLEMELDLVIIGAEWGHGRRTGWLSDYLLAAYDEENDDYVVVGKTFKGLTDSEFKDMTERLKQLAVKDEGRGLFVSPQIVVKVVFEGIQASKRYKSGLALRFARITEIRSDKPVEEVDSLRTVKQIFNQQFQTQSRV